MLQIVAYINNEMLMKFCLLHVNNEIFKLLQSIFCSKFQTQIPFLPTCKLSLSIVVLSFAVRKETLLNLFSKFFKT